MGKDPAPQSAGADSYLREAARIVTMLGCVPLLLSLTGCVGHWHWLLSLTEHFRLHYAVALVPAGAVALAARSRRLGAAFLLAAALDVWFVLPCWSGDAPAPVAAPRLELVTFNVRTRNPQRPQAVDWLRGTGADVLVLFETNAEWMAALDGLARDYPHVTARPRPDNFGVAVLTRRPPLAVHVRHLGRAEGPSVELHLPWGPGAIVVIATHPVSPVGGELTALRDDQLLAVAAHARALGEGGAPVVVTGDLNTTPWSRVFGDMCERGGLRDGGRGRGWRPTWPARLGVLGIPIDHCLLRGDVAVADSSVGPYLGSDHRPLQVVLAPAAD